MVLPRVNDTPKYKLTIPSSQKSVRYRPFLVKEEKVLMIAFESQDNHQMLNAVVDTIVACVDDNINKKDLTTFDVEYMFLQMRAKSVGEVATVGISCPECKEVGETKIKLDAITIDVPKVDHKIPLTDKISLRMKWPHYTDILNLQSNSENTTSQTLQTFDMIAQCIDSVITDDEIIKLSDEPKSEVISFIESLNSGQFKAIQEYVAAIPQLHHTFDYECTHCNKTSKVDLRGIKDFF